MTGRTIVISGGATGIGFAAAKWFIAAGDDVLIAGRRAERLDAAAKLLGPACRTVHADLSLPDGARAVRAALDGEPVDVIVPAAGGTKAEVPAELEDVNRVWIEDLRQNLMTAVLLVEALKADLRPGSGRIIGIGSIGAQLGSGYGGSYGAAKAALHAWIFWLAAEFGPSGITANLVIPGYIPDTEFFGVRDTPKFGAVRVARTLLGRAGTPADVAESIGFLASPGASYITGQLIGLSGGTVLGRLVRFPVGARLAAVASRV